MRRNPYRIGRTSRFGISPRIKQRFNRFPTLRGYEGRWWRRALIAVGVILLGLILSYFLKPETSLMSSVEIKRVENKGILSVGVRDDMPGFCEDGAGFEAELALLLAQRILPDSDDPLRLVTCTSKTVSTKLKDGSIDVAIALQTKSSSYACSYPYFTDKVYLVTLDTRNRPKTPSEMKIGYIPNTSAGDLFAEYVKRVTAGPGRSVIDRLLGRPAATPDPETTVTMDTVKCGSYDELIEALVSGNVDAVVMAGAYVNKYLKLDGEKYGIARYFICDTIIGTLEYCIVSLSDEPAIRDIANMLIYKLQDDGSLAEMKGRYGLLN